MSIRDFVKAGVGCLKKAFRGLRAFGSQVGESVKNTDFAKGFNEEGGFKQIGMVFRGYSQKEIDQHERELEEYNRQLIERRMRERLERGEGPPREL